MSTYENFEVLQIQFQILLSFSGWIFKPQKNQKQNHFCG